MAKQSLVDFQIKLMNRLQSSVSAGSLANWLAIEVVGYRYLIPLAEAGSIVSLSDVFHIEKVAYTRSWFLGVANFRGSSYAVVDLAGWFGLRNEKVNLPELAKQGAAFVTFHPSLGMSCALLVDKISGLRSDSHWQEAEAPEGMSENGQYFSDAEGKIWQVMKLTDLARDEYFLSIEI
ncbi:MAG: chemotaxis protein CheW [Saezia sp.]